MPKICVSATGADLNAPVDPRFGRCAYLLIVDVDSMKLLEAVANPSVMAPSGAGIQTAQMVANKGVIAVITGNVGPNAYQVLASAGIQIFTGAFGTVREAVEAYRAGRLTPVAGSSPMSVGRGMGMGMGMGRGLGMGRGMGAGMGRGMPPVPMPSPPSREEEISILEAQMESLKSQLEEVKRRLRELKGEE
ncbi:MAG: NifB/NifX family molybdenum-iron cluster-binding protein [Candidatus Hecatellaceae archaeon]|nr:MAG: dinitrogenase iron-molybdenum cofactor biosynthesis protein [Candidatus Hecatellales archaeon]